MKTKEEWLEERHRRVTATNNAESDRERLWQYAEIQRDVLLSLLKKLPPPTPLRSPWHIGYDSAFSHMRGMLNELLDTLPK